MRVLVVTVVHVPLDARIHHRQIRALRSADIEVTYAAPWEATATPPAQAAPGVRTFDLPRATGRRRLRALREARRLIGQLGPRHDLILLHDPELAVAVAGRLRRLPPVVLDVHEDLAASLVDRPWVPGRLKPLAGWGARRLERWSDRRLHLLLAEEAYAERFAGDHPVVRNLPRLPDDPPPAGTHDRVVYVGRISEGRGLRELVAIGQALREGSSPIRVEVAGNPDADVAEQLQAAHDQDLVTWHGYLPNDAALSLVAGSIAGLSLLHDLPNYRRSMPTKVVEYLACAVPVVTTPLPEAEALVKRADAGAVVPFGDVDAAVTAIRDLAADRDACAQAGQRGRHLVADSLTWEVEGQRFVALLVEVARQARDSVV